MGLIDIPEWVTSGGSTGLLVLVVLMILTGRLVPLSAFKQLERDRDRWRTAALRAMRHVEALLPGAQISADFARALQNEISTLDPTGEAEEQE